jgi:four helix bundle protein
MLSFLKNVFMDERNQSFTELEVWKKARTLKNELKELADLFPTDEKFRLTDQLIRSSRSINANISEGHGRYTYKGQLHFCIQARGSLSETHTHLIDAIDCKYISQERFNYFKLLIDEVGRLLNGYINFLRKNL